MRYFNSLPVYENEIKNEKTKVGIVHQCPLNSWKHFKNVYIQLKKKRDMANETMWSILSEKKFIM